MIDDGEKELRIICGAWLTPATLICLGVGGTLLGFGYSRDPCPRLTSLVSVPLVRASQDQFCDRFVVDGDEDGELSIGFYEKFWSMVRITGQSNATQRSWIIHNLWGINMSVIYHGTKYSHTEYSRNMDVNESDLGEPTPRKLSELLPDSFRDKSGRYRVICPFNTKDSIDLGIGDACQKMEYPMLLNGDYEMIELGEMNYYRWTSKGYDSWDYSPKKDEFFYIDWLFGKPKYFSDVPELYIASWGDKSGSVWAMRVFGYIFAIPGLCLPIVVYKLCSTGCS